MILSRVFNLGHNSLLRALSGSNPRPLNDEYFVVGHPILNPPRLRGSMVIVLNSEFLKKNHERIKWGSPIDAGGVAAGYFGKDIIPFAEKCKLPADQFLSLLSDLKKLPINKRIHWANHIKTPEATDVISKYVGRQIAEIGLLHDDPHSMLCEVCFQGNLAYDPRHILAFFCPHTYRSVPLINKIEARLDGKTLTYNSKYGVERVASYLACFDRYI